MVDITLRVMKQPENVTHNQGHYPNHHAERDVYRLTPPMNASPLAICLFDPETEVAVVERRLPHWSQSGAITFITWRTEDSMPKDVLDQWFKDR
ncbi:MAG: hypothetical protein HY289_12900, partial [Planctomycetes bacterium]|nr:hypothetical protein [Planctomycetota bacterium]